MLILTNSNQSWHHQRERWSQRKLVARENRNIQGKKQDKEILQNVGDKETKKKDFFRYYEVIPKKNV